MEETVKTLRACMFKVEKYPIPAKYSRDAVFPFADMGVGDSFYVPGDLYKEVCIRRLRKSLYQRAYYYAYFRCKGEKFVVKEVEGGVRVWRVN